MTAKGEAVPVAGNIDRRRGRTRRFFFAQILSPKASRVLHHRLRPISSFMISLVPP